MTEEPTYKKWSEMTIKEKQVAILANTIAILLVIALAYIIPEIGQSKPVMVIP